MAHSSAYGQGFGDRFGLEAAPTIVSRTMTKAEIAVTEIRADVPVGGMSTPLDLEDAYLVGIQLRDYPEHHFWEDGRQVPVTSLRAGDVLLYDLKRTQSFLMDRPFHSAHLYITRREFDALAEQYEARPIGELAYRPGIANDDPVLRNLVLSLQPGFEAPEQVSRLFLDHVTLAAALHVAQRYGGMTPNSRPVSGGLAPWQEKRAKQILSESLDGDVPIAALARECGLSVGYFSRAFKKSVGETPHRWLTRCRVETAKSLLRERDLPLASVARACGFADQSHFSRVFGREVGITPGTWRQCVNS